MSLKQRMFIVNVDKNLIINFRIDSVGLFNNKYIITGQRFYLDDYGRVEKEENDFYNADMLGEIVERLKGTPDVKKLNRIIETMTILTGDNW